MFASFLDGLDGLVSDGLDEVLDIVERHAVVTRLDRVVDEDADVICRVVVRQFGFAIPFTAGSLVTSPKALNATGILTLIGKALQNAAATGDEFLLLVAPF